jgi:hypothetical protein
MGLLDGLMGAIGGQQGAGDFIRRFERGAPWDGIDDRETLDTYGRVSRALPPDEYRQAAEQTFARFSPDERRRYAEYVQQQARRQDFSFPDLVGDASPDRMQDPGTLAELTSRLHGAGPGVLRGLLGGGGGGALSNPLARAALAGIAAMAMKRFMGGGGR